jgi:catechol 2,3-dioxygenase-like lactoylglutathione lyase family enzyme
MRMVARVCLVLCVVAGLPIAAAAQGRCIRAYGTPACNTDPVAPPFARTGWRTTALEQITFKVADAQREAGFYAALLGWTVRTSTPERVVMDIGEWGTVVFERAPLESFEGPVHAVVSGFGYVVDPWDARAIEAGLRQRGLSPVRDADGKGFESFHVKDPDGFDLQISNAGGHAARRHGSASTRPATPLPFAATGWHTVWLDHFSFNAANYKASAAFYTALFGWQPTYDEGSQNELMMADIGDIIIRGGNPFDPAYGTATRGRRERIDHISWGIEPWDTDVVKRELEARGLEARIDTSDGNEIHVAQFKSYHVTTPNGYNLQISYNTHDTRLNLAISVNPRRPGIY